MWYANDHINSTRPLLGGVRGGEGRGDWRLHSSGGKGPKLSKVQGTHFSWAHHPLLFFFQRPAAAESTPLEASMRYNFVQSPSLCLHKAILSKPLYLPWKVLIPRGRIYSFLASLLLCFPQHRFSTRTECINLT